MAREVDLIGKLRLSGSTVVANVTRESARLWRQEEGQNLAEYGLLVLILALGVITSLKTLACSVNAVFNSAATSVTSAS